MRQLRNRLQAANSANERLNELVNALSKGVLADLELLKKEQQTLINIERSRLNRLLEQDKRTGALRDTLLEINNGLKRLQEIGRTLEY